MFKIRKIILTSFTFSLLSAQWQPQSTDELRTQKILYFSGSPNWNNQGTIDTWDVSLITDMTQLFLIENNYYERPWDISGWDVSNVTSMNQLFSGVSNFTSDISGWDVSNVTNMASTFKGTDDWINNIDISQWNVSNVTNMQALFNLSSFNGDDISNWDVSNVTNMEGMFREANNFNQDLSTWNVSNVTDMSYMFYNANDFNQDLSTWNVSNVINMRKMFSNDCSNCPTMFNGNISSWDVSNVTNMEGMFEYAYNFNQDLSTWNVSSVTDMSKMFFYASIFNQDLSNWQVQIDTYTLQIFDFAESLSHENKCGIHDAFSGNRNYNLDYYVGCEYPDHEILGDWRYYKLSWTFENSDNDVHWDKDSIVYNFSYDQTLTILDTAISGINESRTEYWRPAQMTYSFEPSWYYNFIKIYDDNSNGSYDDWWFYEITSNDTHDSLRIVWYWEAADRYVRKYLIRENSSLNSFYNGSSLPEVYILHQNYPNPFNPTTTLQYDLPEDSYVRVTVYDMLGNVVNNLVNDNQNSGYKSVQWNATNNQGQPVSAGLYLYTIQAGKFRQTKKMVLLK